MSVINCFTDASVYNETACAGYVLVCNGKIIEQETQILYDKTNNFGEAYAVFLGVAALIRYAGMNCFLNLYSDSKITVDGIRRWMKGWIKRQDDNGIIYSSSGSPVINQNILKNIIYIIHHSNVPINIYHQLGHKDPNSVKDVQYVQEKFLKFNGVSISEELAKEICHYNDYIDNLTRNTLYDTKKNNIPFSNFGVRNIYGRLVDNHIYGNFTQLINR